MIIAPSKAIKAEQIVDDLMRAYGQEILQLVYAYVHDKAIAEDLTQEIFVKCYRSLDSYKGKSHIKTWLWRIAINHTKDYLKSWYHQHVYVTEDTYLHTMQTTSTVEQRIVQQDEDTALANAVMDLPILYREVIYLFYFEEWKIQEIAKMLRTNSNTVKTRLRKGKMLLKNRLEESQWRND
ncbi:sigma-70 family RNA polymerase sigma factor [Lysinibacillus piscis]|nr:sigma-70 family RNA polymerase sigma factor [Lysinibacillus sp. KH24]